MQNLVQYFVPYIGKNGTIFANFIKNICVCRKKAVPLRRFCVRRDERVRARSKKTMSKTDNKNKTI